MFCSWRECKPGFRRYLGWMPACSVMSNSSVTPWTIVHQGSLSMGFCRQEYWSGLAFPCQGGSSQPRDRTCISCGSCICRQILYRWATWGTKGLWRTSVGRIQLGAGRKEVSWWHSYGSVTRVYAPRFFVWSQQKFGVTDIKAPWRVTALGGQSALQLSGPERTVL